MKYITQELSFKDIEPDIAELIDLKEIEIKEDVAFIRKGIEPKAEADDEGRTITSYISTLAIDRDREIIMPKGIDIKSYMKNPVVLFGHNYQSLPIGKNLWIKTDSKGLRAKTEYANHQQADEVYNYRKDGFPMAESIGFIPIEWIEPKEKGWEEALNAWKEAYKSSFDTMPDEKTMKGLRRIYTKVHLLEYSDVPVPSNPEALQLAVSKGICTEDEAKTYDYIKIIEPGDEITHEIRDANEFISKEFEDIMIHESSGVKAKCQRLKSEPKGGFQIHTLVFSPESWTDIEEAKSFVDKHSKNIDALLMRAGTVKSISKQFDYYLQHQDEQAAMKDYQVKCTGEKCEYRGITKLYPSMFKCPICGSACEEIKDNTAPPESITASKEHSTGYIIDEKTNSIIIGRAGDSSDAVSQPEINVRYMPADEGSVSELAQALLRKDEEIKSLNEEVENMKSGRVLSAKNRKIVKDAIDALTALYEATEPKSDNDNDNVEGEGSEEPKGILKLTDKPPENSKDKININPEDLKGVMKEVLGGMVKESMQEVAEGTFKRMTGKVT
jgi:hypothetical protein